MTHKEILEYDTLPDHGTTYYKAHWAAYKGHVRGILRGLFTGSLYGLIVGVGIFALSGVLGLTAMSFVPMLASFAAIGGIMGAEIMGRIGNAAGNMAAHAAESELLLRYPSLPAISPESPEPGYGHHYEIPANRDKGKIWNWRVGISGLLLGGSFGAIMGVSNVGSHMIGELLTSTVASAIGISTGAIAIPIVAGAIFGLSFGIERSIFKSIFNFTDNILQGKIGGPSAAELSKSRERYHRSYGYEQISEITSLQRQKEFSRLQNEYFKAAFRAGFHGNGRGLLGGIIAGGFSGLMLGALLVSVLSVMMPLAPAAPGILVAITAALGGSIGFRVFTEAAFEAAAHSEVDELQKVRISYLKRGIDIDFSTAAHIADAKRRGDPELTPPDADNDRFLNPKMMIMGGILGALSGWLLAPILGPAIGVMIFGHGVHAVAAPVCAAVIGFMGVSLGLGPKISEGVQKIGDAVFMGTFYPGDKHPNNALNNNIPLFERSSPLHPANQCKNRNRNFDNSVAQTVNTINSKIESRRVSPPDFVRQILEQKTRERRKQAANNFKDRVVKRQNILAAEVMNDANSKITSLPLMLQ